MTNQEMFQITTKSHIQPKVARHAAAQAAFRRVVRTRSRPKTQRFHFFPITANLFLP